MSTPGRSTAAPAIWLLKTEPAVFAFRDLVKAKRSTWDGVTNPQAVAYLRQMHPGDQAWVYHTGDERAIFGLAQVVSESYADKMRPDLTADGLIKFAVVDLEPIRPVKKPLGLEAIKDDPRFADWLLVTNSRLSVMPVPPAIHGLIKDLTGVG